MDWSLPTSSLSLFSLMELHKHQDQKIYYKLCSTASCYYNTIIYQCDVIMSLHNNVGAKKFHGHLNLEKFWVHKMKRGS